MKNLVITEIEQAMVPYLNNEQLEILHNALIQSFWNKQITVINEKFDLDSNSNNQNYLNSFLSAKKVEGCSERTLYYYKNTLENMLKAIKKSIKQIDTDSLRNYLDIYEQNSNSGKVTLDNIRRIISSFFSWLEDENHIIKSPARRIHKIRTGKLIKPTYTDEELETMRDNCQNVRDLAIIDLLSSTGIRVGELVNINIKDIDFSRRECVVLGKGNKQRTVYFDARSKIHLLQYINTRTDNNNALFVSLNKPHNRLNISGIELRLRNMGRKLSINKVHPHKFRRTLATKAIDKGMPIEQVQILLGHTKIDTTLQYAIVDQTNVKYSHKKFIC